MVDKMDDKITKEKLEKYFSITEQALEKASAALDEERVEQSSDFLDMATRYYNDAQHFFEKDDYINAFAAINYAHGWLDAGARIRLFKVNDSQLFTVDEDQS